MADDWKPGDLALCMKNEWRRGEGATVPDPQGARRGGVYTVRAVGMWRQYLVLWLDISRSAAVEYAYGATAFRKIAPLTDEEREESLRDLKLPADLAGEIVS